MIYLLIDQEKVRVGTKDLSIKPLSPSNLPTWLTNCPQTSPSLIDASCVEKRNYHVESVAGNQWALNWQFTMQIHSTRPSSRHFPAPILIGTKTCQGWGRTRPWNVLSSSLKISINTHPRQVIGISVGAFVYQFWCQHCRGNVHHKLYHQLTWQTRGVGWVLRSSHLQILTTRASPPTVATVDVISRFQCLEDTT